MALTDLFAGRLSYRRLWVLIRRLPQESWTQTELRDAADEELVAPAREERFGPWALANYQLASLLDAVRRVEYVSAVAGQLEPKPVPPEPSPRPGVKRKVRALNPAAQAYLNGLRAKGA